MFCTLRPFALALAASALAASSARAGLYESWENTSSVTNGWTIINPQFTAASSTTLGVTDGTQSLAFTSSSNPNYSTALDSPSTLSNTALLADAASISVDVTIPAGAFGFFLQIQMFVNNSDLGFSSLPGGYQAATIGGQATLTYLIPDAVRDTLAASAATTSFGFMIGGGNSAGNNTLYLDNVQVNPIPEPGSLALLSLGGLAVLARRRD